MSLFIKCNIGLPQGCKSCPFNYTDVCIASNKGIDTRAFVHLRHPDCPMVELPTPHGRLIDCESDFFPTAFGHNLTDYAKGWNTCLRSVLLSPTIIEAEVNE